MTDSGEQRSAFMYLDLLKACLTRILFLNDEPGRDAVVLAKKREQRRLGLDWPDEAETMIGMARLDCLQDCVERVLRDAVPGDLLEAGVWRGGAVIFMRAILEVYGDPERAVWAADSFQGLASPDATSFTQDLAIDLSRYDQLAVSIDQVKANFQRYGLLDDRVHFLEGWFKDTLPDAPVERLAVLRMDGDYYESTIQILEALYHKVSPGGFVIVDDYLSVEGCKLAVDDFRTANAITDEMVQVDSESVYWRLPL